MSFLFAERDGFTLPYLRLLALLLAAGGGAGTAPRTGQQTCLQKGPLHAEVAGLFGSIAAVRKTAGAVGERGRLFGKRWRLGPHPPQASVERLLLACRSTSAQKAAF